MNFLGFAGVPAEGTTFNDCGQFVSRLGWQPSSWIERDIAWGAVVGAKDVARNASCLAIVSGHPILKSSGVPAGDALHSARAVLSLYQTHGDDFLERVEGSFAIALIDVQNRRALLAVDRMGIERMAYSVQSGLLGFGNSAEQIARSPICRFEIRQQGLYDFLLMHMIPAPDTIFNGVSKLRPGTLAIFHEQRLVVRSYWRPQFIESTTAETVEQWQGELHASLRAAVRSCLPDELTGAFLSGGLDSSSVVGFLSQVGGARARTFSMGFGVGEYDESRYARVAAKHFNCDATEYNVTPEDVVTSFPLIAKAYDEPFGNSSAVPTYMCALRAAESGITHLLAGDGGDEIFGGNERYVRQQVFENYYRIPPSIRRALLEPLSSSISPDSRLAVLRKFRSYVDQASIPMPERLESWNYIYRSKTSVLLDPGFAHSIDSRAIFRTMKDVYDAAPADTLLNKMLFYDWQFTLSDNDLRKVGLMCELANVQVSYPMLDQRVVDLSLRIPPAQKIKGKQLRAFYKHAMRDFLPAEILTKNKHGFGLPFGPWLKSHKPLRELFFAQLSEIKRRHIVQPTFVDALIAGHEAGDVSYYGYAIWDIAMLEAWLSRHGSVDRNWAG